MSGLSRSLLAGGGEALRSDSDSDGAEETIINSEHHCGIFIVSLCMYIYIFRIQM